MRDLRSSTSPAFRYRSVRSRQRGPTPRTVGGAVGGWETALVCNGRCGLAESSRPWKQPRRSALLGSGERPVRSYYSIVRPAKSGRTKPPILYQAGRAGGVNGSTWRFTRAGDRGRGGNLERMDVSSALANWPGRCLKMQSAIGGTGRAIR